MSIATSLGKICHHVLIPHAVNLQLGCLHDKVWWPEPAPLHVTLDH